MTRLLIIGILLAFVTPLFAQDDHTDNECYAGGRMDGQCTTYELFVYGYYLYRHIHYGEPMPDRYQPHKPALHCELANLLGRSTNPPTVERWYLVLRCR
jgi:hypothetical protein